VAQEDLEYQVQLPVALSLELAEVELVVKMLGDLVVQEAVAQEVMVAVPVELLGLLIQAREQVLVMRLLAEMEVLE
jgi:hypothetical protein